jgi:hypothetical protein
MSSPEPSAPPDLLITGTPRSGTTLLQRIIADETGAVIPPETHFFSSFIPRHLVPSDFPLIGERLRTVVQSYLGSHHVDADADAIISAVDGRCETPAALFSTVVRAAAGWPARVGEKTPGHLQWLPYLMRAMPSTRFIVVVRDPRAVVASVLDVPWTSGSILAESIRWRFDQQLVGMLWSSSSSDRLHIVRYEELVAEPEVVASGIVAFLRFGPSRSPGSPRAALFRSHEGWKGRALLPLDVSRVAAWTDDLTDRQAHVVSAVTARSAAPFGYQVSGRPRQMLSWLIGHPDEALPVGRALVHTRLTRRRVSSYLRGLG